MAVLLRRNEREWENKEKKQKQIQFFKDIVNSRYEIGYYAEQPRGFVWCVVLCNTCKASSYAYKFRQIKMRYNVESCTYQGFHSNHIMTPTSRTL